MILYHGSFLEIAKPDLVHSRPNVDFGRGFYVTPLYEQASGAVSSNVVGKTVLFPGMNTMKAGKLN